MKTLNKSPVWTRWLTRGHMPLTSDGRNTYRNSATFKSNTNTAITHAAFQATQKSPVAFNEILYFNK